MSQSAILAIVSMAFVLGGILSHNIDYALSGAFLAALSAVCYIFEELTRHKANT